MLIGTLSTQLFFKFIFVEYYHLFVLCAKSTNIYLLIDPSMIFTINRQITLSLSRYLLRRYKTTILNLGMKKF